MAIISCAHDDAGRARVTHAPDRGAATSPPASAPPASTLAATTLEEALSQLALPEQGPRDEGPGEQATSLQRELQAAREQLARQQAALEKSEQARLRAQHELQQLVYVVSHDLPAPLRGIIGFLQLLQRRYEQELDPNARDWIGRSIANAEQLRTLLNELLAYSRIGSSTQPFEDVPLNDLFAACVQHLAPRIQVTGAHVTRDELPIVWGDRQQLQQLLQHLLDNSLKFVRARPPRIHVGAERRDGDWIISVQDNGLGIEPKHQPRIFDVFSRLHRTQDYPGTGIGLAVCRRVVDRHGGELWVESQAGQGSIFRFTLRERTPEPP